VLLGAKAGILILAWNHPGAVTVLMLHLKNVADLKLILGKQGMLHTKFQSSQCKFRIFFYHACFGKDFLEKRRIR